MFDDWEQQERKWQPKELKVSRVSRLYTGTLPENEETFINVVGAAHLSQECFTFEHLNQQAQSYGLSIGEDMRDEDFEKGVSAHTILRGGTDEIIAWLQLEPC